MGGGEGWFFPLLNASLLVLVESWGAQVHTICPGIPPSLTHAYTSKVFQASIPLLPQPWVDAVQYIHRQGRASLKMLSRAQNTFVSVNPQMGFECCSIKDIELDSIFFSSAYTVCPYPCTTDNIFTFITRALNIFTVFTRALIFTSRTLNRQTIMKLYFTLFLAVHAASLPAPALLLQRVRLHPLRGEGRPVPSALPPEEAVRPLHHHAWLWLVRPGTEERGGAVHARGAVRAYRWQLHRGQPAQRHRPPDRPVWWVGRGWINQFSEWGGDEFTSLVSREGMNSPV